MNSQKPIQETPKGPLRFWEGGWLLLLMCIMTLALLAWALAGPLLQLSDRPPGDGETLESYAFDLSEPRLPLESIETAMLYRDMPPAMDSPVILNPESAREANAARKPYLVPNDLARDIVALRHVDKQTTFFDILLSVIPCPAGVRCGNRELHAGNKPASE